MGGLLGTLLGIVVMAIGLAGLGVALHEMMTHADPNGTLKMVGGLTVFVLMGLLTLRFTR